MAQGYGGDNDESWYKVFIGNLALDVSSDAVENVVKKCGEVHRVSMKRGFCFCHFKSRDDAQACITTYDDKECQEITDHRLRVEMAKGQGSGRARSDRETQPNRHLFVVNYNPEDTRREDLQKFFAQWGSVNRVQMKDKYSFIEFSEMEMAAAAMHESQSTEFNGRILTVEYVQSGPHKPLFRRTGREHEYDAARHERREGRPPPQREYEHTFVRSDDYRCEPYDRYEPYNYYEYYERDPFGQRDCYGSHPPVVPYYRQPPLHGYRPRYASPPPRYSSRSPPPALHPRSRSPGYCYPAARSRGSRSPQCVR